MESRNGPLQWGQFIYTSLNNSLLFVVTLGELSRELPVINYNPRKIVDMRNKPFTGVPMG